MMTPPAKKPPTSATRKPDGTLASANVFLPPLAKGTLPKARPFDAIAPATKPATKPGVAAIE